MFSDISPTAKGVILMVGAMLIIPAVDGVAKYLTAEHAPLFIGWARYALASLIVLPLSMLRHGRRVFPSSRHGAHFLRTVFIVLSMATYFLAIARIPLATAATTALVGPIIAVILSVLVLKEQLTSRKLISLALGVVGALIIVGLNSSADPGIFYALASGLFFGCYLVATRQARAADPIQTLAFQVFVGALLLTPFAIWEWSTPDLAGILLLAGMALLGTISHMMSISAFRFADASTLAPLVYVELLGVTLIGYFAFDEVPGWITVLGAALIVGAGVVLFPRRPVNPPTPL